MAVNTRPYARLTRRDRALDAAAMAERAALVAPILEAAEPHDWLVRNWIPGSNPREFFEVDDLEDETKARQEYDERAETIRQVGGACELIAPDGRVARSIMRPLGGGK